MRYTEFVSPSMELVSVSGVSTSIKPSERALVGMYKTWTESFLDPTSEMERQNLTMPQRIDFSSPAIIQSINWESSFWEHLVKDLNVSKVLPIALVSIGNYQTLFPAIVERFLPKIDGALGFLNMKIENSVEGIFFNFRGTPRRPPGFVVNMRIVISEYDRELEYKVYDALGKMIRKYPYLLFDAHILASKKRRPEDFLPLGYVQYLSWSG